MTDEQKPQPKKRGFAGMTPERRKEIASMGGKSVKAVNRSFYTDKFLASKAGRMGGGSNKGQKKEKAP